MAMVRSFSTAAANAATLRRWSAVRPVPDGNELRLPMAAHYATLLMAG
jgi:hypothetical protein